MERYSIFMDILSTCQFFGNFMFKFSAVHSRSQQVTFGYQPTDSKVIWGVKRPRTANKILKIKKVRGLTYSTPRIAIKLY